MNDSLLHDVCDVKLTGKHTLWVSFDDGTDGEVDFSEWAPFPGVLAPLANLDVFAEVRIHSEYKTLAWNTPDPVDVDPVCGYIVAPIACPYRIGVKRNDGQRTNGGIYARLNRAAGADTASSGVN